MANEIKMSARLDINTTNFVESFNPGQINIDLSGKTGAGGVQAIATSDTDIAEGGTTAGGVYFLRNLDETNFVYVGVKAAGTDYFLKLLPGEFSIGRLQDEELHAKANTATVNLQYRMLSP